MVWGGWEEAYIKESLIQSRQNERFLRFIFRVLKERRFRPQRICELGVGDCEVARELVRLLGVSGVIYLVDRGKRFLEECKKKIPYGVLICKDFRDLEVSDFCLGRPDLVVSSNSLHWLDEESWVRFMCRLFEILGGGGYLVFHQGLKRSYVFLYDLANELFEEEYGREVNWERRLFYPWFGELIRRVSDIGFKYMVGERFVEEYDLKETLRSFSVAGLNVFLEEIEDEGERMRFRERFLDCAFRMRDELLVFAHRGFFAFRKRFSDDELEHRVIDGWQMDYVGDGFKSEIRFFMEEVADDFVPSLRFRGPDDLSFHLRVCEEFRYFKELIEGGYRFLVMRRIEDGEIVGLTSYIERSPLSVEFNGRAYYVAVFAVKRSFRGLGVGQLMMKRLLEEARREGISLIETRTWETNEVMKGLLSKAGFERVKYIPKHRVDREGRQIGTEYYVKKL